MERDNEEPGGAGPGGPDSIEGFLRRLAARTPTPAGGAVAALGAAQAAALLGMAARFTSGPGYDDVADVVAEVEEAADRLLDRALVLVQEDQDVFAAVAAAYALPKGDDGDDGADGADVRRREAIREALAAAAEPPAAVVAVACLLLGLAERLLPVVNPTLAPDVAAAVEAARSAAVTGRVNVEANLRGLDPDDDRRKLLVAMEDLDEVLLRAEVLTASVRAASVRAASVRAASVRVRNGS